MIPVAVITILTILIVAGGVWIRRLMEGRARMEGDLRRARLQRQALLESALDCVISVDQNCRIVEFNATAELTFGYKAKDVEGRVLTDLIMMTPFGKTGPAEFIKYFEADEGQLLGKRQELTGINAAGGHFPIELVMTRVQSGGSAIFTSFGREITERIKGETAMFERASLAALNVEINRALARVDALRPILRECAQALLGHLDVSHACIWTCDEGSAVMELQAMAGSDIPAEANPSRLPLGGSYLGRLARDGQPFMTNLVKVDGFDPGYQEWLKADRISAFAAYPMQVEHRVVGLIALYDRKDLPPGLFTSLAAVAEGITQFIERSRAERHVREQAELLDKATDAIFVRDIQGRIQFWNKGAEKLYGWTAKEANGRNADELFGEAGPPLSVHGHASTLATGEWTGETELRAKGGREICVQSRWTLVRNDQGQPKSVLVIGSDITEKRQLEKQFLRAQRLEVIGTLAGGIAHDLNNMLAPIMIVGRLIRKQIKDPQGIGWLDLMEKNAMRGAAMVRQILAFARGITGEQTALQIYHLICDAEKIALETFPRGIEVEVDAPKDLWLVRGDATQLHQVLLNLCVNGRDAMPKGGTLAIKAENVELTAQDIRTHPENQPGRYLRVAVSDTGTGIPPEVVERIFEPFFTTKDPGKGTGLGLSTVRNIVRSHGGFIDLTTELGVGTTFTVCFPATEVMESQAAEPPMAEMLNGNGEQILLVDDELAVRELTKATLEEFGYRVLTGNDGAEAVAVFAQNRSEIDAIVIDINMPVMDGAAAINVLRKIDPGVRLVAVSGSVESEKAFQAERLPNTVFLAKPYDANQLLRVLRETLKR